MQVSKWGNSLAVRLPAAVVEALNLKAGDEVEINVAGLRSFEIARKPTIDERLDVIRGFRDSLPEGFKFDRDEANERGADPPRSSGSSSIPMSCSICWRESLRNPASPTACCAIRPGHGASRARY